MSRLRVEPASPAPAGHELPLEGKARASVRERRVSGNRETNALDAGEALDRQPRFMSDRLARRAATGARAVAVLRSGLLVVILGADEPDLEVAQSPGAGNGDKRLDVVAAANLLVACGNLRSPLVRRLRRRSTGWTVQLMLPVRKSFCQREIPPVIAQAPIGSAALLYARQRGASTAAPAPAPGHGVVLGLVAPPARDDLRVLRPARAGAERKQLQPLGAGLEGAGDFGRDAQRVERVQLDDLVVQLRPAAAARGSRRSLPAGCGGARTAPACPVRCAGRRGRPARSRARRARSGTPGPARSRTSTAESSTSMRFACVKSVMR